MAKQAAIERDGTIIEALSNAMFRVELDRASMIVPSLSIAACLAIESYLLIACSMILKSVSTSGPSLRTATANS